MSSVALWAKAHAQDGVGANKTFGYEHSADIHSGVSHTSQIIISLASGATWRYFAF